LEKRETIEKIKALKAERNAIILAHYYQNDEVQEIADSQGDSLALAQQARDSEADVIVFCGVHFMAESAAILNPGKTVLLPALAAGCPMADMVDADGLRRLKAEHPGAEVVCYVNSSAETKAESDICCTSANTKAVIRSTASDRVIFVPDKNLAHYAARFTEKEIIPWEGWCPTHHAVTARDIEEIKRLHPLAALVAHPESRPEVIEMADHVCSTAGMIQYSKDTDAEEIIVNTEGGMLFTLKKACPDKTFILASPKLVCPTMKMMTLESVLYSLMTLENRITVPGGIRKKALSALEKMLAIPRD
jgi:quinolinate synthase